MQSAIRISSAFYRNTKAIISSTHNFRKGDEITVSEDSESPPHDLFANNPRPMGQKVPARRPSVATTGPPAPTLTLHILPHRHARLNTAIYGDEHGLGVRKVDLILESEEYYYKILVPVTAQYDRNSDPIIICDKLTNEEWGTLCDFVKEIEPFKIVLSSSDGRHQFRARVSVKKGDDDPGIGAVQMPMRWKEPTATDLKKRDKKLRLG